MINREMKTVNSLHPPSLLLSLQAHWHRFLTLPFKRSFAYLFLIVHYFSISCLLHDSLPLFYSFLSECCSNKDRSRRYCLTQHEQCGEPSFLLQLAKKRLVFQPFQQKSFQSCWKWKIYPFCLLTLSKSIPLNLLVRQTCLKSNHWGLWLICITQLAICEYVPFNFLRVSFFC